MSSARIAAAVLLIVLAGCRSGNPPEEKGPPPAPVKWQEMQQFVLEEWTELVGTTEPLPDHAARVTAPVEGRVLSVLHAAAGKPVAEGQPVQAGDVLVKLDDTTLRASWDKAVGAKKVLEAEKEASEYAVKQADLELRRLNDLKKQQEGRPGGVQLVAPVELEKAVVALEAAKAHSRADDVKLAAADDEIKSLDRQLKLYTLTAPRKGRLGRLQVVVGQTLTPGQSVAEVIDVDDEINVLCFVPPSDARKLRVGLPAHIGAAKPREPGDDSPDPEGKVEFIAEQAEVDSGLIAVKVTFPNRELKLRANTVNRLRVLTQPDKPCFAIPEDALMEDTDPPTVVIVEDKVEKALPDGKTEETGKARRLDAVIGVRDRVKQLVEIKRLEDKEKKWKGDLASAVIVTKKGQGLQTGDAVKLEQEEDEEPPPMPEEKK
jgi:RND family efflux transporter MFP subunit